MRQQRRRQERRSSRRLQQRGPPASGRRIVPRTTSRILLHFLPYQNHPSDHLDQNARRKGLCQASRQQRPRPVSAWPATRTTPLTSRTCIMEIAAGPRREPLHADLPVRRRQQGLHRRLLRRRQWQHQRVKGPRFRRRTPRKSKRKLCMQARM